MNRCDSIQRLPRADWWQDRLDATVGGEVTLVAAGNVTATAPEFNLTGDVTIDGELFVTGEITDLTGVGSPYEPPEDPELQTAAEVEEAVRQILALLA